MEYTIRQAASEDYKAVTDFYAALIDGIRGTRYYPKWQLGIHPSYEMIRGAVDRGEMYLALHDDRIISAMVLNHSSSDGYDTASWPTTAGEDEVLVIHILGVLPEEGCKGIGAGMVNKAICVGRKTGQKAIRLDVLKGNLPAEKLYLRTGFIYVETVNITMLQDSVNLIYMNINSESGKRIICYGDSNTFGHDPRSYIGDQYPPDIRWTGRLRLAGWDAVNLGLNGRQIPAGGAELDAAAAQICSHLPADRVIVMLGTNDLLWNPSFRAEDAAARMELFLRRLVNTVGSRRLLLISPPAMQAGSWVEERRLLTESKRLGGLYSALAERLSFYFADSESWGIELSYDGIHLTEEGHRVFAENLCRTLEELETLSRRDQD